MELTATSATDIAIEYHDRGWSVIPVAPKQKRPLLAGWQNLRLDEQGIRRHFATTDKNIGVLLGEPSGWIIDIDIDHPRAVQIAARCLPDTVMFGRRSSRRSHYIYSVTGSIKTKRFTSPLGTIIEIRSSGCQTVFPGSTHESGEAVEWDLDGEPATITPDELMDRVQHIFDLTTNKKD